MSWTPFGSVSVKNNPGGISLPVAVDIPAGSAVAVHVTCGHLMPPITCEGGGLTFDGGDITQITPQLTSRVFTADCPDGLAAGATLEIDLSGAGQGGLTIAWAQGAYSAA